MDILKRIKKSYASQSVEIRASIWFLISSFLQKGISVLTTPVFTRLLSTSEYGQYNVFNSWLGIITIFVTLNISQGVYLQGLVKFENDKDKFSSSLQGLTLLLVLFWTGIYILSHRFWDGIISLSFTQVLAMFSMIWTTAVFSFWAAEQRVELQYKKLVVLTILVSVIKPIVGVIAVLLAKDKVTARIVALAATELIFFTGLFFKQYTKGRQLFSKSIWLYALSFSLPLIPHYLSQIVLNSSDRIMIDSLVGTSEAGIYSLAYSISQIMHIFNTSLLATLSPWIYRKIKGDQIGDISKVAYGALVAVAIVNLCLIILAPEAISFFAPAAYQEAIWIIPPVAMSVFFVFSYNIFAAFEFYFKKTFMIAMASALGAVLNIVLNRIFIPVFGYYVAGYTTLVCYIIYAIVHYLSMRSVCKKELNGIKVYNWHILAAISIVFVGLGFAAMLLYKHSLVRYGITFIVLLVCAINRKRIQSMYFKLRK